MAVERIFVHRITSNFILICDEFGGVPHDPLLKRIPKTVVLQRIGELLIAIAETDAAIDQIRGLAHALHAAGYVEVTVFSLNRLRSKHDCFQSRAADLVDRRGPDRRVQAGENARLARRRLAHSSRHYVSHDHFVEFGLAIEAGTFYGCFHGDGAQLRGGEAAKRTEKLAYRGAYCAEDDRLIMRVLVCHSSP